MDFLGRYKTLLIIILVGAMLIAIAYKGHQAQLQKEREYQEEAERIEAELEKETYRTEEAILNRLEEAIIESEEDNVYMRVPDSFSEKDIEKIAGKIDPFIGRVKSYTYTTTTTTNTYLDGSKSDPIPDAYVGVNYKYEKRDEFYVYQAIVEGKPIPSDKKNANKLKSVCEKFMKENINSSMTDYDKELAIHDYIIENCEYSFSDGKDDTEFEAFGALVNHKAVCSGYALATELLLKCCGIEATFVTGDSKTDRTAEIDNPYGPSQNGVIQMDDGRIIEGHAWNQVKIGGIWYNLDVTWDDPLSEDGDVLDHYFFNVDDTILAKDHDWDTSKTERCSSTISNYYEKNGIFFKTDEGFQNYIKSQLESGYRDPVECAVTTVDTSEEQMSFIFGYDGITSYQIGSFGEDGYKIITIYFNSSGAEGE